MWGDRAGGSQEEGSENPGEVVSPGRKTSRLRLWSQILGFEWALRRGDLEGSKYGRLSHPAEGMLKVEKWSLDIEPVPRKTLCFC